MPDTLTEQTFAIIKPDAVSRRATGQILARIEQAGFLVRAIRQVHLTKAEVQGFYAVHSTQPFFAELVEFMSSSPCVMLTLESPNAIAKWRTLMGATDPAKAEVGTLRKAFGTSIGLNAVHGSDAPKTAAFELKYFSRKLALR
jgi:nucleoside-diphosphate kinase